MKRPFEPPRMTNPSRALPPLFHQINVSLEFSLHVAAALLFPFRLRVCTQCVWLSRTPSGYAWHVSQEEKPLPTHSAGLVGESAAAGTATNWQNLLFVHLCMQDNQRWASSSQLFLWGLCLTDVIRAVWKNSSCRMSLAEPLDSFHPL